jgi:Cd2+/Zn2+-exporting ATPase
MEKRHKLTLLRIIFSALLFAVGLFLGFLPAATTLSIYFYIAAAVLVGFDVLISAINGIIHGHILDENFLMTLGSVCAFVLGEYAEGTFILLFYQVGELFQALAVGKSRRSIAALMDIRPDFARLYADGASSIVDPYDVTVGDIILVEPGEKIPLDGIIVEGRTDLDSSSLTGESAPVGLGVGDEIISGSVNLTSPVKIRVTKEFDDSTVSKILELVENASTRKTKTENFVTSFAKYYTPAVVIAALLTAVLPPLLFSGEWSVWTLRAVMFVVISCPCALVVSVPMAFFGALGGASRQGILIKGSNYLESLAKVKTVVFDKTGTLTNGSFKVTEICPSQGQQKEYLLEVAAICEAHSSHPIALAVKSEYNNTILEGTEYKNIPGRGVSCRQNGKTLLAGNAELMTENGYSASKTSSSATVIHLADGEYLGYILISDTIRPCAYETLTKLHKAGVTATVMLTGDRKETALEVAKKLSIDEFHFGLLPADKIKVTEEIMASTAGKVAFVGDGINDAPVIARADVGFAMGGLGSDAAIEASDIVIMNDDLTLIPKAIKIASKALRISKENIMISLSIKFSFLILSFLGLANIWMAVFADVGVLILALLNSMRTLSKRI